ncbi:hypothetical protein M0R19_01240 [Candidatus Pacearchaeota archaeon]|nr:hypothetical protein [Candidatus Pacearchaeota archaeon]
MENTFSNEFKRFFLIKFTEELIRQSAKKDIIKLQEIIELKEEKKRKKIVPQKKEQIKLKTPELISNKAIKPKPIIRPATQQIMQPSLLIPEPKLPSHLEYLRPVATSGIDIDLMKINPLIKDPAVRVIESNPDEKVKVTGAMGVRETGIILSKEDIDRVIDKFSQISKIPKAEGVYRVAVGNLVLSAIISDTVGSRFMIKKMLAATNQPQFPKPNPPIPRNPIINRPMIIPRNNLR